MEVRRRDGRGDQPAGRRTVWRRVRARRRRGGLLISGTLVGARHYLEYQRSDVLADLVQRGLPPLIARKVDRAFATDLEAMAESDQAERDGAASPRRFIHLKDACVIADGGHRASFVVPYWRGQLR